MTVAGKTRETRRQPKRPRRKTSSAPHKITVALQGGGAHGAFTWGVLDRLLEDERLEIEGISGTSAGAMNGAMVACGLSKGGRDGARELLATLWERVADSARFGPLQPGPLDHWSSPGSLDYSPAYHALDLFTRVFSPYQINVFDFHPLREVLEDVLDFECLRCGGALKLFVCATNVRTGKLKIFQPEELSVDALLASACLPDFYKAVEVGGEHYWDGGYVGNPAVFPLMQDCAATDVVLVQINPISTPDVPTTARAILDRVNEISFNSSLMREMRAIGFITKLIEDGMIDPRAGLKRFHMHMIEAEAVMSALTFSSKLNAERSFVRWLRDLGRDRTETWLNHNFDKLGVESSIDLDEIFL